MSTLQKITVGLIGYGLGGATFHAPLIQATPQLRLAAVATSRSEAVERDMPGVRVAANASEALADPSIELVVISTPTATHFELARAALLAGKHVVVDKPFTVTVVEADALIELADRQNRMLSVFQNRRWDNDFLTVRRVLREGRLGTVYQYEAHYDRFRPQIKGGWRDQPGPGAGVLYDLGAHLIDQSLQLFGMPRAIMADVFSQRPAARTDDYFHLVLDYGRMRAILHSATLVRQPGPHFAIHGDQGSFVKYGMDSQEDALKAGQRPGDPGWGADPMEQFGEFTATDGSRERIPTLPGAYEEYYKEVVACLSDGGSPPVNPRESRDVLRVIEAALESSAERRAVAL